MTPLAGTGWYTMAPGSTYSNMAFGREKGEVAKDEEGLNTDGSFGKKMAWLIKETKER